MLGHLTWVYGLNIYQALENHFLFYFA